MKDKFQVLFQIITLFEEQIRNTSCLTDFQMKSDLKLNNFQLDCNLHDAYWFNYKMQTTITLSGGLHYLIWHSSGKSLHSVLSTCAFL